MHTIVSFIAGVTVCFLIKGDGWILVDTGINVGNDFYENIFRENSINPRDIRLIVITHGHSDHFANIDYLKRITGAEVLCHRNAAEALRTGISVPVVPANLLGWIFSKILKGDAPGYKPVEPDLVMDDSFELRPYGVDGRLIYTPGHTDCSISLLLGSGEAFTGDMFMRSPFASKADSPLPAIFATDKHKLLQSMRAIIDSGATTLYGSHGGVFGIGDIRELVKKIEKKRGYR